MFALPLINFINYPDKLMLTDCILWLDQLVPFVAFCQQCILPIKRKYNTIQYYHVNATWEKGREEAELIKVPNNLLIFSNHNVGVCYGSNLIFTQLGLHIAYISNFT